MDLKSLEAVGEVDESGKEPMEQSTLMENTISKWEKWALLMQIQNNFGPKVKIIFNSMSWNTRAGP